MAEDAAGGDRGQVALENVQIGAADGGLDHPHDGVGGVAQRGPGHVFQLFFSGTAIDEGFHGARTSAMTSLKELVSGTGAKTLAGLRSISSVFIFTKTLEES